LGKKNFNPIFSALVLNTFHFLNMKNLPLITGILLMLIVNSCHQGDHQVNVSENGDFLNQLTQFEIEGGRLTP
jgi:hypothetical protein